MGDVKNHSPKKVVYVKRSVWNEMINHCKEELPNEACGLISGRSNRCEVLWKMKNMKQSPNAFEIDEKEMEQSFLKMEKKNHKLTGIYHSHPTAQPYPSKEDIENAHYPDAAYFIISLARNKPQTKCFQIKNKKVIPMEIKIFH